MTDDEIIDDYLQYLDDNGLVLCDHCQAERREDQTVIVRGEGDEALVLCDVCASKV